MMTYTYLDYNATAPVWPQVADAVAEVMRSTGNPSSVHAFGRGARSSIEVAREKIAKLINAKPSQVIFTSGGTEANSLALNQMKSGCVLMSAVEHDSILKTDRSPELIPVSEDGSVDTEQIRNILLRCDGPAFITVMLANNETGVLQPVETISILAKEQGVLSHCDAVQAVGKVNVDWQSLGVNMMSISAHKLGGPQGIGALIIDEEMQFSPLIRGGGQERKRRAGTENVAGIVGFGVAAELVLDRLAQMSCVANLRDDLENGLKAINPAVKIHGFKTDRLPNTTCVSMPGVASEVQVATLDLKGIMISAGSACSSGKIAPSHVLTAMGLSKSQSSSAIRVSLGWDSDREGVDRFLTAWRDLYLRNQSENEIKVSAA